AKNLSVDGSAATAKLTVDANAVVGTGTTKTLSLTGGTAADTLVGADANDVATTFTGGEGKDTFALNAGNTNGSITDFVNGDSVAMSAAGAVGAVAGTFVNGLGLSAADQTTVEAGANLTAAVAALSTALGGIAVDT